MGQNLTSSLVACYALNGTGYEPVNNFTGTLSAVTPTLDRFNQPNGALKFSGTSGSYVVLPNNAQLKPSTGISISAWVKLTSLNSQYIAFAWNGCSSYHEGYSFTFVNTFPNTKIRLGKANSSCSFSGQDLIDSQTSFTTNVWYHVGCYFGNDSLIVYVNGVRDAGKATFLGSFTYANTQVFLGVTNQSYNLPFSGTMDNVRFYNRKLTLQEWSLLYSSDPSCIDPLPGTQAAFSAPDTVCVNQPATIQNLSTGSVTSFYYSACGSTSSIAPLASTVATTGSNSGPAYSSLNKDGTDYYEFVTNNVNNTISRLYYGNSLSNTPTVSAAATLPFGMAQPEGIHVQKEGSSWYGLVVGGTGGYVARLSFGNSLGNAPTITNWGNIGTLSYPHNIHVFKSGQQYHALVLNRNSNSITRLDFGNSISNTPSGELLNGFGFDTPSQMAVLSYSNSWHVFVVNDGSSDFITRLDFGNSLLNRPVAVNLGNPGGLLNNPRGVSLYPTCDGIRGHIANTGSPSQLLNVAVIGSATGPLSLAASAITANLSFAQTLNRTRWGDTTFLNIINVSADNILRLKFPQCLAAPSSTLQNPGAFTFSNPGTYTLALAANENQQDQSYFCKAITIVGASAISVLTTPASTCANVQRTLTANGASSYTWYPGAQSGPVLIVNPGSSTTYTVVGGIGTCTSQAVLTLQALPSPTLVAAASSSSLCSGESVTLAAIGALTYSWNPGNLVGQVQVTTPAVSTTYTVSGVNAIGCVGTATMQIGVTPVPTIGVAASAFSICTGSSATLTASGAASYTWLPGNVHASSIVISPASTTIYTVTGSTGNCLSESSVQISVAQSPTLSVAATAQSLCPGQQATLSATGAPSYFWFPGSQVSSSIVVAPGSASTYTVVGSNGTCSAQRTITVGVYYVPNPFPSASPSVICRGQSATLTASGVTGYTWIPGFLVGQNVVVSPTLSTAYILQASTADNCTLNAAVMVSVNPVPTVIINPASTLACQGQFNFSASGATAYSWQPGGTTGSAASFSLSSNTTVSVTGMLNGCQGTATAMAQVIARPNVLVFSSSPSVCAGTTVTFTATGANSYSWIPGGFTGSVLSTVPVSGQIYTVTGFAASGCSTAATISVAVAPVPAVSAQSFPPIKCTGQNYTLSAAGAASYTWLPGGAVSQTIVQQQANPGVNSYTVVGSQNGCTSNVVHTVQVNVTPLVALSASSPTVCSAMSTTLSASGASTYTYLLVVPVVTNQLVVFPGSTTSYTVAGTLNGCTNTAQTTVSVMSTPTVAIVSNTNVICSGQAAQLTGQGAASFTWMPGNSNGSTLNVTPQSTTAYTLVGENASGCRSQAYFTLGVNPTPTVTASASNSTVCRGNSVILTASGASAYTWTPGGIGATVVVTPSISTVFSVTGQGAGCAASTTVVVVVTPTPNITVVLPAPPNRTVCAGQSATLQASGAMSFTWMPGGLNGQQIVVTPSMSTIYTVTGRNAAGCTSSAVVMITVIPVPVVAILAMPPVVCIGSSVTLFGVSPFTYTWLPMGVTGSSVVVTPAANTTYSVIQGNGSCTVMTTVSVGVTPSPEFTVAASPSVICAGSNVSLSATPGLSYTWQPGNHTGSSFTATPLANTVFSVTGATGVGCARTQTAMIIVEPWVNLVFQNPPSLCAGKTAALVVASPPTFSLNGAAHTGSLVSLNPAATTGYTLSAKGSGECVVNAFFTVEVLPNPLPDVSLSNTIICRGGTASLVAQGEDLTYKWLPVNLTGSLVTVTPSVNTTYTLVSSNASCSNFSELTLAVTECPLTQFGLTNAASAPLLYSGNHYLIHYTITVVNQSSLTLSEVELRQDLAFTFPSPCSFSVQSLRMLSHGTAIQLNNAFDGRTDSRLTTRDNSMLLPGKRDTLLVGVLLEPRVFSGETRNWVVGEGKTAWGFIVSDSSNSGFGWDPDKDGDPSNNNAPTVVDLRPITFFVPEAFSPDGDGLYDELVVKGLQGRIAVLTVYNRWGNKVYETSGTSLKWDGYSNTGFRLGSGKVPQGTYYYVLQFSGDGAEVVKGFIALSY